GHTELGEKGVCMALSILWSERKVTNSGQSGGARVGTLDYSTAARLFTALCGINVAAGTDPTTGAYDAVEAVWKTDAPRRLTATPRVPDSQIDNLIANFATLRLRYFPGLRGIARQREDNHW